MIAFAFPKWRPQAAQAPQDEPLLDLAPTEARDVIARGEAAQRLLNDPVLEAAFAEIRQDAFEVWIASKPSEGPRREELHRQAFAVEIVRSKLRAYRDAARVKLAQEERENRAA